jgi:uncharacterized protein DUF5618
MKIENKEAAQKSFDEATRYMSNARKELGLAMKHDKVYEDLKHMRVACGTAYLGVLRAVDGIFILRNIPKPKGKGSIEYYQEGLSKIDKKMLRSLNVAYRILHIDGYYDGFNDVKIITYGFEEAENILKKLKQSL